MKRVGVWTEVEGEEGIEGGGGVDGGMGGSWRISAV